VGVFRRFERGLEGAVTGVFARVFRSAVQPVEIASALQRELDNSAQILSRDSSLVPNDFTVLLSVGDYDRLAPYMGTLSRELAEVVSRHAATQSYSFTGPVTVAFERLDALSTGRFRVRSSAVASVTPGRRADRRQARPPQPMPQPLPQPMPQQQPQQPPQQPPRPQHQGQQPQYGQQQPAPPPQPPVRRAPPPYLEVGNSRHPLEPPGIVLGRGTEADLRITDPGVSRRHAEIRVSQEGPGYVVTIHDLGSTNGIVVNGRRVDQATLDDGSQVLLGNTLLVLRRPDVEVRR
jgi:pSer/pThr/pTyr-binding forkhead associated (FHA) protein